MSPPLLEELLGMEEDRFATAPPTKPPPSPLFFEDGFADPDDFEDDLLFDEEPESPFIFPNTRNSTATITTAARVTKTMIAVNRSARGMLYNS